MSVVYILDRDLNVSKIFETYDELVWSERYRGSASFEMKVTGPLPSEIRLDNYLQVPGLRSIMIIEELERENDIDEGEYTIVKGRDLTSLLERRVFDKDYVYQGNVFKILQDMLNHHFIKPSDGNRKLDGLFMDFRKDKNFLESLDYEIDEEGGNVGELINKMSEELEFGYHVYFDVMSRRFGFSTTVGVDLGQSQSDYPPVMFSRNMDNISDLRYLYSNENYKNVAYVYSEYEEDVTKIVSISGDKHKGIDRREVYVSASDIKKEEKKGDQTITITNNQHTNLMVKKGNDTLRERESIGYLDGSTPIHSFYKYGKDYKLGDIVSIVDDLGDSENIRVVDYVYSFTPDEHAEYPVFETVR